MQRASLFAVLVLPWLVRSDRREPVPEPGVERSQAHYAAVERELRARDVSDLSPEQRAARERMIAALDEYRERGVFTRNTDFPGARAPYFVDREGRLCAVANLLHESGEDALVGAVAEANNHVWVSELAASEPFRDWLERVGLSFDEAVRIQGPGNGPLSEDGTSPPPAPGPTGPPQPWRGPADGPAGPATAGSGPVGSPLGGLPSGSSPSAPTTSPGRLPIAPGTPAASLLDGLEDWEFWWEYNKLRWLIPECPAPVVQAEDRTQGESAEERERRALAPRIIAELASSQPEVRAAAALAFARAAGGGGVPRLLELLQDSNRGVRESAILALGASRSEEAVHALLTLLRAEEVPTPRAKPLAIVALAVARLHGRGRGTEGMLASLLGPLEREGGDEVRYALLLHQHLAPSQELGRHVRCFSGRFGDPCPLDHAQPRFDTRARALEALRFDGESAAVLPRLLDAVHGRAVDERRSAACALADVSGALDPLLTAFELEEEPLTRGCLLLSIGERGEERARSFLEDVLAHGRANERPWAALALGIAARESEDGQAREALRKASARAGRVERGAILLALGLARDREARTLLARELERGRSDKTRMFAALALGLIGEPEDREVLLANLIDVRCAFARAGIAQALALYRNPLDAELLLDLLREERRPEFLRDLALALGLHGSPETLAGLSGSLEEDLPPAVRAAALDALGIHLAGSQALALAELGSRSNLAALPDWVLELLQHPL